MASVSCFHIHTGNSVKHTHMSANTDTQLGENAESIIGSIEGVVQLLKLDHVVSTCGQIVTN